MIKPHELWCPTCDVEIHDPDVHLKVYGQVDTCPKCKNKYEKYNPKKI